MTTAENGNCQLSFLLHDSEMAPGDARPSPKPQPIGNFPLIFLFTTCGLCAVFILWRKSDSIRAVVAHQLQTWNGEGRVRLSQDDGPSAAEFLGSDDEFDDDNRGLELEDGRELESVVPTPGPEIELEDPHRVRD